MPAHGRDHAELPRWLGPRRLLGISLGMCGVALAVGAGFVWFEASKIEQRALDMVELQARVLQDHANRTLDTTEVSLHALADSLNPHQPVADLNEHLSATARSLPFLRSLSLVDAQGNVLASSTSANVGLHIQLEQLQSARSRVGELQAGRDLAERFAAHGDTPARQSGQSYARSFIPYVRSLAQPAPAPSAVLVAALNPDFFANAYELTLDDPSRAAALLSMRGQVIASTASVQLDSGAVANHLRVFQTFLPSRESGSYIGPGIDQQPAVTAFRSARSAPWVVVVEQPHSAVLSEVLHVAQGTAAAVALACLVIACLSLMARRSLHSYSRVREALATAHAEVERREIELRQLIESIQELMFRTDATGHITFLNRHGNALQQKHPTPFMGQTLSALVHPLDQSAALQLFEECRQQARSGPVRLRLGSGDAARLLEVELAALEDGGYAGFALDVTEREAANQAKAEFLANITHELRTPLQSILGFSELGTCRTGDTPKLQGMFERIHGAGERMLTLVNNLLDLSRVNHTTEHFQPQQQDVQPLAAEVLAELQPLAAGRGLQLRLAADNGPHWALVDAFTLQQVIRNVLANALRFAPAGSAVQLRLSHPAPNVLQLSVLDSGPGIPPAELHSIFEPFVQSTRTKNGAGGTGLGLAICRKIMALHGGKIEAHNRPEGGAAFVIELPVQRRLDEPPRLVTASAPADCASMQP